LQCAKRAFFGLERLPDLRDVDEFGGLVGVHGVP
jgi:hypothetical protein